MYVTHLIEMVKKYTILILIKNYWSYLIVGHYPLRIIKFLKKIIQTQQNTINRMIDYFILGEKKPGLQK